MAGYGGTEDEYSENAQAFIDNHIDLVRSRLPTGDSAKYCIECGEEIPLKRREALVGVKHCVHCQEQRDKHKIKIKTVTYML